MALKPNSSEASVTEWYNDSPKLLKHITLIFPGCSSMKSKVTAIPLKIEFTTSFLFMSLKLIGQTFFKISRTFFPEISMIAFE